MSRLFFGAVGKATLVSSSSGYRCYSGAKSIAQFLTGVSALSGSAWATPLFSVGITRIK